MKIQILLAAVGVAAMAAGGEKVNLWPEGKMPSVCENQKVVPYVEFFRPEKMTTDACIIVAPGGGYGGWAESVEGYPVRDYFLEKGMSVAMFRYRTPRPKGLPKHLTAWQDAQRAVRLVRSQAEKRGYSADKIGFIGFSAGGHLTMMAAASAGTAAYEPVDELDKTACNVNWAVPVYPAYILADGADGCNRSRGNNLDKDVLVEELAFDRFTPPMCLLHGDSDGYSPMGSVRVYHKLRTMGIPAELHVMAGMGHVFFRNCRAGDPAAKWLDRIWEWLYAMGINTIHPRTAGAGWRQLIMEYSNPDRDAEFEPGVWTKDAQCVITASKDSAMWFKGEYENFVLDFEYKLDPGANSGVLIYCGDTKNWIPNSVEIQLLDDANPHWKNEPPRNRNGAIYGHLAPKVHNARPAGEWNRMTVWAEGKRIRVAVNNEMAVDCNLDDWKSAKENPDGSKIPPWLSTPLAELPTKGRIGFQGKHGAARPYFRQIYIKKLK